MSKEELWLFRVGLINALLLKIKKPLDFPVVGIVCPEAQSEVQSGGRLAVPLLWGARMSGKDYGSQLVTWSGWLALGCQGRVIRRGTLESVLLRHVIKSYLVTLGRLNTLSELKFPPMENGTTINQSTKIVLKIKRMSGIYYSDCHIVMAHKFNYSDWH